MAVEENAPFGRGEYETTSGAHDNVIGRVYEFPDRLYSSSTTPGIKAGRLGSMVKCMLVKNSAGAALLPKRLVVRKTGTTGEVDGYTDVSGERALGLVDEFLPTAGVPSNAYFYIVVEGPALALTDLGAGANNLLPIDTVLIALTAATSGATTAGRVAPQSSLVTAATTHTGADIMNAAQNKIGAGLTAKTTTQTNNDILVMTNFLRY